ncbi:hypothetical protein FSPOR_8578 [Fusarium sporotrichioides]|uniref:Major facilitator superfamily (MFS) profile domain-containing protein n=1 Tax=Fusarium sporotrichioides TaxID=5514 RepID=A0A395RTS7_FUSSP|nr:hypothetical protein FSPOR_8578 [Fusarium sporotrichioides]
MDKPIDSIRDKLDECGAVTEEHAGMSMPLEPYGPSGFRGLLSSPYVAACAAFSAIGGLLFGYDQGVISVTLVMDHFLERFPEVSDDAPGAGFKKGLMTAMITLGAFIGAINQGWIADWISRKRSLMVAVVIFTIGSTLQTAAVSYPMLVVGRFIGGIGIGQLSMVVPLYISEISPPEIRGSLLVFEQLSIVIGIVVAFWITYGTKILPGLLLGFGAIVLPYSPRWLASKDREEEALLNLAKLRALPKSDHRVQREFIDIVAEARFQASALRERHPDLTQRTDSGGKIRLELISWTDCFKPGCWRRTLVGAGLMFFQQFTGINALIYYSPTLFGTMGLNFDMQLIMSGALNVTQLLGVFSSLWTMDRFGRRGILLWGSLLMFVPHLIIAILVGMFSKDWPSHTAEGWTSVAFLLFYMLAYGASWGPVPWAMPAEVFPSSLRAKGVAISTCSSLITPPLVRKTGFGAYLFFAVFCLLSFIWVWFSVPETNGKSLEEMDQVFNDRTVLSQKPCEAFAFLSRPPIRAEGVMALCLDWANAPLVLYRKGVSGDKVRTIENLCSHLLGPPSSPPQQSSELTVEEKRLKEDMIDAAKLETLLGLTNHRYGAPTKTGRSFSTDVSNRSLDKAFPVGEVSVTDPIVSVERKIVQVLALNSTQYLRVAVGSGTPCEERVGGLGVNHRALTINELVTFSGYLSDSHLKGLLRTLDRSMYCPQHTKKKKLQKVASWKSSITGFLVILPEKCAPEENEGPSEDSNTHSTPENPSTNMNDGLGLDK